MGLRTELHNKLTVALGNNHVYFDPPENIKMEYPCIVYELDNILERHANDATYSQITRYRMTYITKDPDSELIHRLPAILQYCSFSRSYQADNLHHYIYYINY